MDTIHSEVETAIFRNLKGVRLDLLHRLNRRIVVNTKTGCWEWTGPKNEKGYGILNTQIADDLPASLSVHRLVHELSVGPIPLGYHLHHKCRIKSCCRPDTEHVKSLTPTEHGIAEGQERYRLPHCGKGHEFTPENTGYSKRGKRKCKECAAERKRGLYFESFDPAEPQSGCEKGHVFDEANTYWYTSTGGYRARGCRICRREAQRAATIRKIRDFAESRKGATPTATHCIHGHEYAVDGWSVSRTGQIRCLRCARDQSNARNAAIREARGPKPVATHCVNGHLYDEQNTYVFPNSGRRVCKECRRASANRYARGVAAAVVELRKDLPRKPPATHCKNGHEWIEANIRWTNGKRFCKACHSVANTAYFAAKRKLRIEGECLVPKPSSAPTESSAN